VGKNRIGKLYCLQSSGGAAGQYPCGVACVPERLFLASCLRAT
jgi:hypothetical protein